MENTTTTTSDSTVPALRDLFLREELALKHLEQVKRELLWAQQELGSVRADIFSHYTQEDIQQGRKEGWGVITI